MSKPMRVLITDGDNRSALAATRSLGRLGHEVIVAGERAPCLASVSRHCSAFESYPPPTQQPDAFVAAIASVAARRAVDVVLPMTEVTTLLLTRQQAALPSQVSLPFASADAIAQASNKAEVLRIAAENGVPIPATRVVANAAEAADAAATLGWPTVIKPARSRVRTAAGFVSTGVSYAHDAADLKRQTAALDPAIYPLLLQERIEGPGVGLFACYDRGRPVARFAHRRIREKPPSGGVSVLRESAPLDPNAVEHADRLLRALGWHGVAMVEFKRDRRDNSLRLMEINGRFWGSLQLAIDAGVDFPAILLELARGNHPELLPSYQVGVRSRWWWGDVDSLLLQLFRSRAVLNLPPDHPGRLRALWDFMHFWGRDLNYEVFRRDDLKPWLLETKSWFRIRA